MPRRVLGETDRKTYGTTARPHERILDWRRRGRRRGRVPLSGASSGGQPSAGAFSECWLEALSGFASCTGGCRRSPGECERGQHPVFALPDVAEPEPISRAARGPVILTAGVLGIGAGTRIQVSLRRAREGMNPRGQAQGDDDPNDYGDRDQEGNQSARHGLQYRLSTRPGKVSTRLRVRHVEPDLQAVRVPTEVRICFISGSLQPR